MKMCIICRSDTNNEYKNLPLCDICKIIIDNMDRNRALEQEKLKNVKERENLISQYPELKNRVKK